MKLKNSKMTDLNPSMSVIMLNVNRLNPPISKHGQAGYKLNNHM